MTEEASAPAIACPGCGAALRTGLTFCEQCGTRVGKVAPAAAAVPAPPVACPGCGAALRTELTFCDQCGTRVGKVARKAQTAQRAPAGPRRPNVAAYAAKRAQAARTKGVADDRSAIRTTRICMAVMALLMLVVATLSWWSYQAPGMYYAAELNMARATTWTNGILGGVFILLTVWAGWNAFAAIMTALVLWATVQVGAAMVYPMSLISGWLFKILIVSAFVGGIRAALSQRRREAAQRASAAPRDPDPSEDEAVAAS
jgi:hypothetical protein